MENKFRYLKIAVPTKSLIVVDLKNDRIDGQIAACVLQGIINRDQENKIYVTNTYCYDNKKGGATQVQIADRFLDSLFSDLPTERLAPVNDVNWPGFRALLRRFAEHIKGLVIWDPHLEQATIEAATTVAAQTDGLVVSPKLAQALSEYNFPVIVDFRNLAFTNNIDCLDWLIENWFEKACHKLAFTWSHMTTDEKSWGAANKDYVVAMKLFTYYLDITDDNESAYYAKVLRRYLPGTPILGWTDERWADDLFAKLGYFMVPYISVENLTVHSSFPATTGKQSDPKPAAINHNGVYIAFFIADGDNLLHSMIYEPDIIMSSSSYDQIPMTWIINPGMVDLAPRLFNWYYDRLGQQEFGAMLSDGHPHSDRYQAFKRYCEFCEYYLNQAGMLTLKQMEESEAVGWNVQPYVMNSGYAGICPKGIGPYDYHMDANTFHIGSVELVNADSIRRLVRQAPTKGPLFFSVFCGTAVVDQPTIVQSITEQLKQTESEDGVSYYFLRSMDLGATYRAWLATSSKK